MLDIAIVGLGCRFPGGVAGGEQFWNFVRAGGDGMREIPADRWNVDRFYSPDPDAPGRMYTRRGGFLEQSLWEFDPEYFGIAPREAMIMDPQQRLLLEVAVEALDDAGLAARVGGREVGVYVGGFMSDNQVMRHSRWSRSVINSHTATSGTFTMLSNRLSYVLDLHGPSMTIDTACSSSLVALHEATQAVARGECEVAIAGGVNAMLAPETFVSMCKGRFLAVDGRCKTFDATADGYARGEGAGAIVLKPLAAAQADGDQVYAVIRATGANQDGRTSGITVPNPVAQAALARRVLRESGFAAHEVGYVEAHGTGTSIGDPIELEALGAVYGNVPGRHTPLVVGSVKAGIGHLEAAAGVASVIKTALVLRHREIAPQAWLDVLNPAIPFDDYRIEIPREVRAFPAGYSTAVAAVNGFGYGGSNAHAILAAVPSDASADVAATPAARPVVSVFPVSGRTDAATRASAAALADVIEADDGAADGGVGIDAVQAAAWSRRQHHPFRLGVGWDEPDDLVRSLREIADGAGRSPIRTITTEAVAPVFVFSGMGPQWWGMGRDLLTREGAFRTTAYEIDEHFREIAGWSVVEALLVDEEHSRVTRTEVAQPANFLLQVALTAELAGLGVRPAAVLGHSVGEVSAAYVSGALSLDDALLVSYHRARLQATTAGTGGMLAVGLPEAEVTTWLDTVGSVGSIDVAAVNSPSSVTLAGDTAELQALGDRLVAEGVFARALRVEVPYHSHLMDPILDQVRATLASLTPRVPVVPLYSSVRAAQICGPDWGADYWVDNVRRPVRFADALATVLADGHRLYLEVGPHPVLSGNVREQLVRSEQSAAIVATLSRSQPDLTSLRDCVAELYAVGALDTAAEPGTTGRVVRQVPLPAYPWQRTRLWVEPQAVTTDRIGSIDRQPLLGDRLDAANPSWQVELSPTELPWLVDHVVDGLVVLPGAAYLDAALAAAAGRHGRDTQALENVRFVAPRILDAHDVPVLRLTVEPSTDRFHLDSRAGASDAADSWAVNVHGRIVDGRFVAGEHDGTPSPDARTVGGAELYAALAARGLAYGPSFRRIVEAHVAPDSVVATVDASIAAGSGHAGHTAHPAVVDAALQCVAALVVDGADTSSGPVVPYAIASVRRFGPFPEQVTVSVRRAAGPGLRADIAITDDDGTVLLELIGVEFRPVRPDTSWEKRLEPYWYELCWHRSGVPGHGATAAALQQGPLLVVQLGADPGGRAAALLATHPDARAVRLADDPAPMLATHTSGSAVEIALRDVLRPGEPATVVYVPGPVDDASPAAVAGLLATAAATQRVLDAAVLAPAAVDPAHPSDSGPQVYGVVLSEQAFGLPGDTAPVQLGHSGLVGLRRTLRNEQPGLAWRHVDVEPGTPFAEIAAEVLLAEDPSPADDEVVLRGGLRLVAGLERNLAEHLAPLDTAVPLIDAQRSFRVHLPGSQLLPDLALREIDRVAPGPGQVEVRVLSAGVNYKDMAKVVGLLTDRELAGTYFGTTLGLEAIGIVERTGPDVTEFRVGDRLSIGARDALSRFLTLDVDAGGVLSLAPTPWADTDSALNLPFLTAHHSLVDAARLRRDEWVLVHGAAGGVGLAAIQVAKRLGAHVVGTASSPERRDAARAAGADVTLDSRSLTFVDDVRAITGGRGADVVLNSAPGEVIAANLQATAEFGRIVEIGKSDIYGDRVLPLAPFDRNLTFIAVDIDRMLNFRRADIVELIGTVNTLFEKGEYRPLPTTVYSLHQIPEAFEAVGRGTHIGRVVIDFSDPAPLVKPARPHVTVRDNRSYLLSGGFGAFGLAVARWLARAGARHLVLCGRRGATTPGAVAAVQGLRDAGVQVTEALVDITAADAVHELVAGLRSGPTPLAGVFHAAGVLDDRPFPDIDEAALRAVFAPKVDGALNLHRSTQHLDLDHFVVFSSASAITGTVPQGSYAAANTVLDSLVAMRRLGGLPATTVNWGSLAGGMAGSSEEVERYLAMIGLEPIDLDVAAALLGDVLALGVAHTGIIDIDWARWGATHPASAGTPRWAQHVTGAGAADSGAAQLQAQLMALPDSQRAEVVAYMLAEQLAVVLGIPADTIDLETPLPDLGMDSLMAVELQARVNIAFNVEVSALEFGRGGGLGALAGRLLPLLGVTADEPVPAGVTS